jgi:dolichol kinase
VARGPAHERGQEWQELQRRLRELRAEVTHVVDTYVPPAVQREAHRKGFHMTTGILVTPIVLYAGLVFATLAGLATLLVIVAVEYLQARHRLAVPVLTKQLLATRRPGELFSWASTTFLVVALLILWLVPTPIALAALAMLGIGDGLSALVGKSIGRNKLWYNRAKSWEGSLAGFLAGALGALLVTWWFYTATGTSYPFLAIVPICIAGALAASVVESLPQWEDNVSVPLASAGTMMVLWFTTGLAPQLGPLLEIVAGRL